jgi:Zn-dependent protease
MTSLGHVVFVMALGVPAMILHESGHVLVALLCGVKVKKVGICRRGMYTVREPGPRWINVAISAAGPLMNLLLAFAFWNGYPIFAEVNLIACLYNLLPIPNSDGTRILALLQHAEVVPRSLSEMHPEM